MMTALRASDSGSAAVWGSKRINPRPQSCLCLTWSGYPSNDDDDDNDRKFFQTFFWQFVVHFAQQLLAIVHCQDYIPILWLFYLQDSDLHHEISGSTFLMSNHSYTHLPMLS